MIAIVNGRIRSEVEKNNWRADMFGTGANTVLAYHFQVLTFIPNLQ